MSNGQQATLNKGCYLALLVFPWEPSFLLTLPCYCGILFEVIIYFVYVSCMYQVIHTKMGEGRRVAIPAEMCQQYGLEPGAPVVLESSESGILVRPLDVVIREVQAFFADVAPADVLLSEQLIRDRREEAAREDRG
jgi:bifunctional DNA-binding transcriptional regulator/antitoxin component of YhaV-PrlF toxin-antitoxin module